jgi:hypothetical protein
MAGLKVFISSTCYDMHATRAQLRSMLLSIGYEPVMSDQADVIYDPRIHTHTSCLREVANCDAVVLLVGSRFGGSTVPKALELIDLDRLADLSRADRFGEDKTRISITQAEVLQAIQTGLPVFAFIDAGVMRDHLTYEKNKNKPIINQIEFSSIDKNETAPYIFEFINFLRLRNENNSIFEFSRFEDIEIQLKKQWAGLFQRLLHEQRTKALEGRRIDNLSSQIADLKAAVLGSISSAELKDTAKGAIRFRQMLEFLYSLASMYRPNEATGLINSQASWDELMKTLGIVEMKPDSSRDRTVLSMILLREDGTYYRARQSLRVIPRLIREWEEFQKLGAEAKGAILDAVLDSRDGRPALLIRHYNERYLEESGRTADDEVEAEVIHSPGLGRTRILLSADKFIEESIKNFLVTNPSFQNITFVVEADKEKLDVLSLPSMGKAKRLSFPYTIPRDGVLTETVQKLQDEIQKGLSEPG